jgi:hypothetical protein
MKKLIATSILLLLIAGSINVRAQKEPGEYLGLPGDNLNLYAVMDLFRESETLEGFERNLNDENSKINNLDLNGDNLIDYIMVSDYVNGDDHTIVLSVAISKVEKQDVAVFTVNKLNNGSVQIQLIGDEELYGKNYIIEPIYDETPNPGFKGNNQNVTVVHTTTYEVAAWPMMMYIYQPTYVVWRSGWYYDYYPSYWHPWSPFYYHYYYGYHSHWYPTYYQHYRHWDRPRYQNYNTFYYSNVRSHSPQVDNRIREGNYRTTYSHPEMRSDGEKKGITSNPVSRRSQSNLENNRKNNSSDQIQNDSRRNSSRENSKSSTETKTNRREEGQVRSSDTKTEKSVTTKGSSRRNESTKRSTTTAPGKSVTKPETVKSTNTERRQEKPATTARPAKSNTAKPAKTESSSKKSTTKTETATPTRRK